MRARLVLANAQIMVVRKGGEITYVLAQLPLVGKIAQWIVEAEDVDTGKKPIYEGADALRRHRTVRIKQFFDERMRLPSPYGIRLIKRRPYRRAQRVILIRSRAYILQNER